MRRESRPSAFTHYDFIMVAFFTVLVCSNFIGAPIIGGGHAESAVPFGAGVLFPIPNLATS